jgi:hypothetical protein
MAQECYSFESACQIQKLTASFDQIQIDQISAKISLSTKQVQVHN